MDKVSLTNNRPSYLPSASLSKGRARTPRATKPMPVMEAIGHWTMPKDRLVVGIQREEPTHSTEVGSQEATVSTALTV